MRRRSEAGLYLVAAVGDLGSLAVKRRRIGDLLSNDVPETKRRLVLKVRVVAGDAPGVPTRAKRSITNGENTVSRSSSKPTEMQNSASFEVAYNRSFALVGAIGHRQMTTSFANRAASGLTVLGSQLVIASKQEDITVDIQYDPPPVVDPPWEGR